MKLKTMKAAVTVGVFLSGFHLIWSLLVLFGLAQPLLDFIFWAHMIGNPYQVTGFTLTQSATLILVTFAVGYVVGWAFAWLWNKMHK